MALSWHKSIVLVLCALLVFEELNAMSTASVDRFLVLERMNSVPKPPSQCRSFFVGESPETMDLAGPSFVTNALYPHNVDAMLIAEHVNLPTINGFASFNPTDWDFGYPGRSDYPLRVEKYANNHALGELCKLDLTTMLWDVSPKFVEGANVLGFWDFASNAIPSNALDGFSQVETFGRWSIGHKATFRYTLADQPDRITKIRISVGAVLIKGSYSQRMIVWVNGGPKREFHFVTLGPRNVNLELPASSGHHGEIGFEFPDAISPKDLGINNDPRQLAVAVRSIRIQ